MRKLIRNSIALIFLLMLCERANCQEGRFNHRGYGTGGVKNNFKYTCNKGKSTLTTLKTKEADNTIARVYPNPATDFCFLSINQTVTGNQKAELYSSKGKILTTINLLTAETKINLSAYAPATYYIRLINDNNCIQTLKLIKL